MVVWAGALAMFCATQETRESGIMVGTAWEAPLWKDLPVARGSGGADTRPAHDEMTAFCEQESVDLMAAGGRLSFFDVRASAPTVKDRASLNETLGRNMPLYPEGFLHRVGLRGVALAREIRADKHRLDGVAFGGGRVVLDGTTSRPDWVFHHELGHVIEGQNHLEFPGWEAQNPAGFEYQPEGWRKAPKSQPCFVSAYATSGPKDDRAELFAAMMTDLPLTDTCTRAKAQRLARAILGLTPSVPERLRPYLTDTP